MPIPNFQGRTFVAFSDISGFKEMMKSEEKAAKAINSFYTAGYRVLEQNEDVAGMFVSDCAILFVKSRISDSNKLLVILNVVEQLNRALIAGSIMLTTSIAYGDFSYHQRIEFDGIEKNPIYGYAYMSAFLDNESGHPKIQPGQCRILKKGLPENVNIVHDRIEDSGGHLNYYWMVSGGLRIQQFKDLYNDAYQQKYRGMQDALMKAVNDDLNN